MIIFESIGGRYRAVLREREGGVRVSVYDRGALYRASLPKPCGTLIEDGPHKGAFAQIASDTLAHIQQMEDDAT
jgi:hypothetical protein